MSMMLMHGQRSWNTRKGSIRKGLTRQNQETTIKKTFLLSFDAESSRERERAREHRCERERARERESLLGRMSITGERNSEHTHTHTYTCPTRSAQDAHISKSNACLLSFHRSCESCPPLRPSTLPSSLLSSLSSCPSLSFSLSLSLSLSLFHPQRLSSVDRRPHVSPVFAG